MLYASIEFKEHHGVIRMWCERDSGPFDDYILGHFETNEEGYYVFHPSDGAEMSCKHLRTAAVKADELNSNIEGVE